MEPQLILEIWKERWRIPLTKEKEAEFKRNVVHYGLDKFDRTRLIAAIDQHRRLDQISNSLSNGAKPRQQVTTDVSTATLWFGVGKNTIAVEIQLKDP
jgi:hypothetical protein